MEAVASSAEFTIQTDRDPPNNGSCAVSSSSAIADLRKITFQSAIEPFIGFSNGRSDLKIETLIPSYDDKPDGSDGLDPELTFSKTFQEIGAGLENLDKTSCFINSVLQCLTYTEPLAAYLQKVAHEKPCKVAGFCALCAMQKHVRTARQGYGTILPTTDFVSNLRCVSRTFRNSRHEDAHEYMINLLECMHKCCFPSGVPSESSDAYKSSFVYKIFGGSLRSQVRCEQCSFCSDKFDPFLDLSLDISKADSLQRALLRFTAVELLDGGAKVYQCERCKQKVKAKKQLTVSKAPYVLTVHLKRFEAHTSGKIDKIVEFAPAIDMKPFVSGPYEGNLKYTLYGVLVHRGPSIHYGHYVCFVRTLSGIWHSLNDNIVCEVSEEDVFNEQAYMLFYVRDRQNIATKNAVVKKDTSKESLATNIACSLDALVANGTPLLRSCDQGAPAVLTQKDLNDKETQKDPPSRVEAKEILKAENGTATLRSCVLGAPAGLAEKDLNTKETLQKEVPLPQANGEGSLVKEDSEAACAILPRKESPLLDGSTNTQILVTLPTSGAKDEISVDEKNSVNNLDEPANSLEVENVSIGDSPIEEAVVVNQTLGHHSEELTTLIESIKATSDEETLTTPRKTRKRNKKTLQARLTFFKLSLGVRKKKKQKKGRSSTLPVNIISEELLSKKRTSQITGEVASGSACLHVHDKRCSSNGNMLFGSPTGELKERRNQSGAVLASDQEHPLRSCDLSEASQNAKRKREQILLQKEHLTILTRGLSETVVAKWGEEASASTNMGKSYVGDEWDEEYDRWKKKK